MDSTPPSALEDSTDLEHFKQTIFGWLYFNVPGKDQVQEVPVKGGTTKIGRDPDECKICFDNKVRNVYSLKMYMQYRDSPLL